MKRVKDKNDLVVGKEYSNDGIRILIYEKEFDGKYLFSEQIYEYDEESREDILVSESSRLFDEQQIKNLVYYDN